MTAIMNHTMLRIRDPLVSLPWYAKHFGLNLVLEMPVKQMGFTNYFLAVDGPTSLYKNTPYYKRQGVLELCHNYDAKEKNFVANNGNKEPHRGFGHICFSVNKIEDFCSNLEKNGVNFQKKLTDGRQKNIAFALDPDGYWIEIIENQAGKGTRLNHSMVRVKDPKASLDFYQNVLGMSLIRKTDHENAKFSLYFLGFNDGTQPESLTQSDREGIIELTHNWGTESEEDFSYHNGNDQPQGFGHFGIAVENVDEAMAKYEQHNVKVLKARTAGKMKFVAFIADPDGYWIEILPKAAMPDDLFSSNI